MLTKKPELEIAPLAASLGRVYLSINDSWTGWVAGEWHNNHHLLPGGIRSGFLSNQPDIAYRIIRTMIGLGFINRYRDDTDQFFKILSTNPEFQNRGNQGGVGAALGGGSNAGSAFGATGATSILSKLTYGAAIVFMVTTISLTILHGHAGKRGIADQLSKQTVPAVDSATPAVNQAEPGKEISGDQPKEIPEGIAQPVPAATPVPKTDSDTEKTQ